MGEETEYEKERRRMDRVRREIVDHIMAGSPVIQGRGGLTDWIRQPAYEFEAERRWREPVVHACCLPRRRRGFHISVLA